MTQTKSNFDGQKRKRPLCVRLSVIETGVLNFRIILFCGIVDHFEMSKSERILSKSIRVTPFQAKRKSEFISC